MHILLVTEKYIYPLNHDQLIVFRYRPRAAAETAGGDCALTVQNKNRTELIPKHRGWQIHRIWQIVATWQLIN